MAGQQSWASEWIASKGGASSVAGSVRPYWRRALKRDSAALSRSNPLTTPCTCRRPVVNGGRRRASATLPRSRRSQCSRPTIRWCTALTVDVVAADGNIRLSPCAFDQHGNRWATLSSTQHYRYSPVHTSNDVEATLLPFWQQYRSNVRLCRSNIRLGQNVEIQTQNSFDIVTVLATMLNVASTLLPKMQQCRSNVRLCSIRQCCFDIVSHIVGNFALPEAQNRTNRPARGPCPSVYTVKGKEEYLYSAFYILCISQSAQA